MSNGVMYLSGGMEKAANLGAGWRLKVSKEISTLGFTPLDITAMDIAYSTANGKVYMKKDTANFLQYKSNIRHQFIYTDLRLIIEDSDAVIAYYDEAFRLGAGSFAECQCAYDNEKPLLLVSAFPFLEIPGWLGALSTKIFLSFEELYAYLASLPPGIMKADKYGNHSAHNQYLCSLCGDVFDKRKHHYVSKVSPLFCKSCVDLVQQTREKNADRYQFIVELMERQNTGFAICKGCNNKIDPNTCGCGGSIDHSSYEGHSPVPMGCDCCRVKSET